MKAISIKQPWASYIVNGEKTIETRTRKTPYRGRIIIVSSKTPKIGITGKALGSAKLINCRPMVKADESQALCNLYKGAYAWILTDIEKFTAPFPVKGKLGLYEISDEKLTAPLTPLGKE